MIWGTGIDDFVDICFPSLCQPGNVPLLLLNGYRLHFDIFTLDVDEARVSAVCRAAQQQLGWRDSEFIFKINARNTTGGRPSNRELKSLFFDQGMRIGIKSGMKTFLTAADHFYGNGSVSNAIIYAKTPGVVVCGISLRVDRQEALQRLQRLGRQTGSSVVSNAQLVDISLKTMIPALKASIVDIPENSSFTTAASLRRLSDTLFTLVLHLPSPFICSFSTSDREFFFGYCEGQFVSVDHIWPGKLIAEKRWRVLGSSDLFFCAELTTQSVVDQQHSYTVEVDRLYNEEHYLPTQHSQVNQCFVTSLRAEPTFTD